MKQLIAVCVSFTFALAALAQQKVAVPGKTTPHLRQQLNFYTADSVELICTVSNLKFLDNNEHQIKILKVYKPAQTAVVRLHRKAVFEFLQSNAVLFADAVRKPKEELTTGALDLSVNEINKAHFLFPPINGNNINVSVKEQLFDSLDIDLTGRVFNSGIGAPLQTTHAAIMATMVAGGGNSSERATGAAPGAAITSSDFAGLLPDADSVYKQFSISVQNHSYGTGIENYYGSDAVAYDMSVVSNPSLLHVFSAGNSGGRTPDAGTYTNVEGYANITGSFKMGKNIVTVGAVDSLNQVMEASSKGPAYDGRIKPELVAFGEDGTSGAAALVSGTAALVQQTYISGNSKLPSAALVKAILLNSADDVGTPGIDFASGFGSLNAYHAVQTVMHRRFFEDSLQNKQTKFFNIHVPVNTVQLKITLAWTDTAALPNAAKALVNDLDITLRQTGTENTWMPWVLNATPEITALQQAAVRGRDTLNNVEQITLSAPAAGTYLVGVTASHIETWQQLFAIAYQIDTAAFEWNYPSGADKLQAQTQQVLKWKNTTGMPGRVDFSVNGNSWQPVAAVSAETSYVYWKAPDLTGWALLRFVAANGTIILSDTFTIAPTLQLQVGFNCADSFLLYWNRLPATAYQVYTLGNKYMQPAFVTNDSFAILKQQAYASPYFAVAPLINQKPALRSFTRNYVTQQAGCYVNSFYALPQNNTSALLKLQLGSLYNVAAVVFEKNDGTTFQPLYTIDAPKLQQQSFLDEQLSRGVNRYRAAIHLSNGMILYSDEDRVRYFPDKPVIIYPNPCLQQQAIRFIVQDQGLFSIQLYNLNGQIVKSFPLNDVRQTLAANMLPKGIYFVKVNSSSGSFFVEKLIIY